MSDEKLRQGPPGSRRGTTFGVDAARSRRAIRERWTPLDAEKSDLRPRTAKGRRPVEQPLTTESTESDQRIPACHNEESSKA